MRITGWRVDGYGVLADHVVTDLPEGVTIVFGPNEAGKSTLLAFVRHLLFGFPDRRRREAAHEPVFGGRHGGALFLRDDAGGEYVIERHADRKEPVMTGPRGAFGELDLRRLLGEADASLFSSVFAFGLDELASLQALETEQVRDRVFSAGVLGAGRSATQAARRLEQRRADLVRQRKADAKANALQVRLAEVDQRLREARLAARHYPQARSRLESLEPALAEARAGEEAIRRRVGDLDRLRDSWPLMRELAEVDAELSQLSPSDEEERAIAAAPRVRELLEEATRAKEWSARRDEMRLQRERVGERLAAERAALTGVVAESALADEALAALEVGDGLERADELVAVQATAAALRQAKVDELTARRDQLAELESRLGAPQPLRATRPDAELTTLEAAVDDLERWVRERDRLEAAAAEAARDARVSRLEAASAHSTSPLAFAVLGFAVLLLAAGGLALERGAAAAAAVALVGAAALALLVVRAARRARPALEEPPATMWSSDLVRANDEVARRARELELPERASIADVEALARLVRQERAERTRAEAAEEQLFAGRQAVALAESALGSALAHERAVGERLDDALARFALDGAIPPERLPATLRSLERAAALVREIRELDEGCRHLDEGLGRHGEALRAAAAALGLDDAVSHEVSALGSLVEAASERSARRRALQGRAAVATAHLADSFGEGESARRLREELMSGAVLAWEEERDQLAAELAAGAERLEALFDERATARAALDELLSSDDVAALELERAGLEAELAQVIRQWATLGLARGLLVETLARYERERQPEVIRRAGELFSEVTNGRYVQLVAREDPEGGRSHGLEVLSASRSRVDSGDLSRGTAEQLYLCLRLALAATFAERSARLPIVLDDVLVNFDPQRAEAIAGALAKTAAEHQVLAFTCHPHVVELLRDVAPGARVVELERR